MTVSLFGTSDAALRKAQNLFQNKKFKEALQLLEQDWAKSKNMHTGLFTVKALHALNDSKSALARLKELSIDSNISNLNQALISYDQNNFKEAFTQIEKINQNNYHKKPFLNWVKNLTSNPKPQASAYLDAVNLRFTSLDIQARVLLTLEKFMPIEIMLRAGEESIPSQFNPLFFKTKRINKRIQVQEKMLQAALKAIEEKDLDLAIHLHTELLSLTMKPKENYALLKKIALAKLNKQEDLQQEEKIYYLLVNTDYKSAIALYSTNSAEGFSQEAKEMIAFALFSQNEFKKTIELFESIGQNKLTPMASLYYALAYYHDKKLAEAIETIKSFILQEPAAYTNTLFTFFTTLYPDESFSFEYN